MEYTFREHVNSEWHLEGSCYVENSGSICYLENKSTEAIRCRMLAYGLDKNDLLLVGEVEEDSIEPGKVMRAYLSADDSDIAKVSYDIGCDTVFNNWSELETSLVETFRLNAETMESMWSDLVAHSERIEREIAIFKSITFPSFPRQVFTKYDGTSKKDLHHIASGVFSSEEYEERVFSRAKEPFLQMVAIFVVSPLYLFSHLEIIDFVQEILESKFDVSNDIDNIGLLHNSMREVLKFEVEDVIFKVVGSELNTFWKNVNWETVGSEGKVTKR